MAAGLLVVEVLCGAGLVAAHLAAAPGGAHRAGTPNRTEYASGFRSSERKPPSVAATPAGSSRHSGTSTDNSRGSRAAPSAVTLPPAPPVPTAPAPLAGPARRPAAPRGGNRPAAAQPVRPASATLIPASAPISCATDLPLAQAPDRGYNFLCTQAGNPVTWSTNRIVIYTAGLTSLQQLAFTVAVTEWTAASRFRVSYASSPSFANVTVTGVPLGDAQPGYVEDGYTTVSYRCDPGCSYDSARVELSTTATLLQADWVSTILHELGHVAGLNHVSQVGEVMYPYLTAASPVAYARGDLQGLQILAAGRGA